MRIPDAGELKKGPECPFLKKSQPTAVLTARRYSGGNAQKIVVGRELSCGSKVLVAAQPTRGVDVGAIEAIHPKLLISRSAIVDNSTMNCSSCYSISFSIGDRLLCIQSLTAER